MEHIKIEVNGIDISTFSNRLERIETTLNNLSQTPQTTSHPEKLLTRKEVAELLNVSCVTLHDWTKKGIVKAYRIGNRIRYKETEIMETLTNNQTVKQY
jgi:excisionase family DNA binding protein